MAKFRERLLQKFIGSVVAFAFFLGFVFVSGDRNLKDEISMSSRIEELQIQSDYFWNLRSFFWKSDETVYEHVWPVS